MNIVKQVISKYKNLIDESNQLKKNLQYRVRFYNCWKQSNDDMYWNRYIKHHRWLDGNNLNVAIFSVFGRRKFIEKVDADVKIFFTGENLKKDRHAMFADHCLCMNDIDLAIGFELFDNPRYVRFPLWMDYMFEPESSVEDIKQKCKEIRFPDISEKYKFTSFVASAEWDGLRKEMVENISQISKVDCGGRYLHNDDTLLTECEDNKMKYIKRYFFNICPENDNAYGGVTEKIFEAISSGCIPIYWGSYNNPEPNVINSDAVIFWDRDNRGESAVKQISELYNSPKLLTEFISQPRLLDTAEEYILDTFSDLEKKFSETFSRKLNNI